MEYKGAYLHNHTEYSNIRLLDSINKVDKLIQKSYELGASGIAITEHECLSSHVKAIIAYKELLEKNNITFNDFKLILGNEIYLVDSVKEIREQYDKENNNYWHFILLAKDFEGYKILRRASSTAWNQSYYQRRLERVPLEKEQLKRIIDNNKGHLIGSTACLGGELPKLILNLHKYKENKNLYNSYLIKVEKFIKYCIDVFGIDDFYLELQPSDNEEQIIVNQYLKKFSKQYNLKLIVTTDSHYLNKEDRYVHKAYLNSKNGEREVDDFYKTTYLMPFNEIYDYLKNIFTKKEYINILNNTLEICDKCEFYDLFHKQIVPEWNIKDSLLILKEKYNNLIFDINQYENLLNLLKSNSEQNEFFFWKCYDGLITKIYNNEEKRKNLNKYLKKWEEEAETLLKISPIIEQDMSKYYNTMTFIMDLVWNEADSIIGVGRGSANGFLSCYLMDITQDDPVIYNLPSWRHLDWTRPEIPDIDFDSEGLKRGNILNTLKNHLGYYNVLNIATFGTEKPKSAVLAACFKKGQLVLTKDRGKIPINALTTNDYVYTTNNWEKVNELTHLENQKIIKIKVRNSTDKEIFCTPDHEFLTVANCHKGRIDGQFEKDILCNKWEAFSHLKSTSTIYQRYYSYFRSINPVWKAASEIGKKDWGLRKLDLSIDEINFIHWNNQMQKNWGIGISENIKIDEKFCELLGIYLAEGSSNGTGITFTIHKEEKALKQRIIKLMWDVFSLDNVSIYERKDTQAINITYTSKQLIKFFSELFEVNNIKEITQWNKYVPKSLLHIAPELQLQIFKGWFLGDGYARIPKFGTHQTNEAKVTTVSKQLADDMIFILNRNFINPTVIIGPKSENRHQAYNVMFYGEKAKFLYSYKYETKNIDKKLLIPFELRYNMDIPVIYNNEYYLRTKIEKEENYQEPPQEVFCIKVNSQNFTLGDTIVHNCRGYRSEEYPEGIDIDIASYLSSMVKEERGFLWSLHDCFYGNEELNRKPIKTFIAEAEKFDGLKEIMFSIEGLVNKRGIHASGVYLFNNGFIDYNAIMKAPNGNLITQFDMNDSDYQGCLKYDFLTIEALDKIRKTLDLLIKFNYIEFKGTLKETYNAYLHPDVLNYDNKEMWESLYNNEIIDAFQMNTTVGQEALRKIKPTNVIELAHTNSLMRLKGEYGKISPIDKYVLFKNDISLWYKEMDYYHLTEEEQMIFEKYLLQYYGVAATQEDVMKIVMEESFCNLTLKEANKVRKAIAKKKKDVMDEVKIMIGEKAMNPNIANYIWTEIILPQSGYAFSLNHTTPYTLICIQEMNLYHFYPSVFWNTACLSISAAISSEDEIELINEQDYDELEFLDNEIIETKKKINTTNYDKIAIAIGEIQKKGINVSLPDINISIDEFTPDAEHNKILYGLKGISNISDYEIEEIINNRPFNNFNDFLNKTKLNKTAVINLIKAGCFDNMEDRYNIMFNYIILVSNLKKTLNLRNFQALTKYNLLPQELELCKYTFMINKLLKEYKKNDYYIISEDLFPYFENLYGSDSLEFINDGQHFTVINIKTWENMYEMIMDEARNYIKANLNELLLKFNLILFDEQWEKYCLGSLSKWEMDSVSFYFSPHELSTISYEKYGLSHFSNLPSNPEPIKYYKHYPIYDIYQIAGTVLGKNKIKSTITLLDSDGSIISIKFRKEYFNFYDKQISEIQLDGTKKVIEKSWFKRGNKIIVSGYRRDNDFIPKTYSGTPFKMLYHITKIDNNELMLQSERIGE